MRWLEKTFPLIAWGTAILLLSGGMVLARLPMAKAQGQEADRTLSPYFLIQSGDPEVDQLPLKSTSARVDVVGVIADVTVTQVYQNEGKKALEALYVFPASTRAAVYGMKMTIGERTITAKIQERERARQDYEQAKREGRSASLLEQQRPNVFQMNVANILPGDVIKVEMKYTELLMPTDGVYEFIYPTVVGPRYSNQPVSTAAPSEMWIQNPYLHEGHLPTTTFDIRANVEAGLPIREILCPSHKVQVQYGASSAAIDLDPSESSGGNRDFILRYRLAGGKIESGLLLYQGERENFFLLMMQPPKRVIPSQIPPREYIFIVDVSGSMHGFPLEISKQLLKDLIGSLRPVDTFNVLLFSGGSSFMAERSLPATQENIQQAIHLIDQQQGGGGTELLPALKRALSLPRSEGTARTMVIATDGYVTVEEETFDLIRKHLGDANLFPFGIGTSVNRFLIEGMARMGMGEPFILTRPEGAAAKAEQFRRLIQSPVMTRIRVDFGKFDVCEVEPPSFPDLLAERPLVIFGKWRGRPQGKIIIRGMTPGQPYERKVDVGQVNPQTRHAALRHLWARHRIAMLGDYNHLRSDDARIKEITRLGLTYNLLTPYTSFVAIDREVRATNGETVTVKQALPLPQGVSDLALGGEGVVAMKRTRSFLPVVQSASPSAVDQSLSGGSMREEKEIDKQDREKNGEFPVGQVQVSLGELMVKGGLSREEVRKALEDQISSIRSCFREVLKHGAPGKGKMFLRLTIDTQGRVSSLKLVKKEPKGYGPDMELCLLQPLKALRFSPPRGGSPVTVTCFFLLSSS